MPRHGDYLTFEAGMKILEKNCRDSLGPSNVDLADFSFKNAVQALTFAAYTDSIIPIDTKVGVQPIETGGWGSGDVSNEFHKNLFLLRGLDTRRNISLMRLGAYAHPLHEIFREFDDFLKEDKYLAFVNHSSLEPTIRSIMDAGYKPSNFVLYVSDGLLNEAFYNYPAIEHFKHKGYFTGFWTPRHGSDLIAVRIPEYQELLEENGFICGGASFFELELAPLGKFDVSRQEKVLDKYDMIYIEVEARMNLALRGSQTGIGQKQGLSSRESEVYGVGPVSDIAGYLPPAGKKFGNRYRSASYGHGPAFRYPERLGAIIFDCDGKMAVIDSDEQGFEKENETISDYKAFLRSIFLNRLPIEKIKQITDAKSFEEFVKTWTVDFQTILTRPPYNKN